MKANSVVRHAAMGSFALMCLVAPAKADILILKQHNYISADTLSSFQWRSSDSLTSWKGSVGSNGGGAHANASQQSTIGLNEIMINGATKAAAQASDLPTLGGYATASTQLQFRVSATRSYYLVGTLSGAGPTLQLFRDGQLVSSGQINFAFLFEVGHTYEVDCSAVAGAQAYKSASGYGFSMQ